MKRGDDEGAPNQPSADADSLLRAVAAAPAGCPPSPDPERIGHYRVVGVLGRGGMGIVYRAEDEKLRRVVALKVLRPGGADDRRTKRFLREARSAAAVNHPNVAAVYEVGEADGRAYIAMELVNGKTLRDRLAAEPALTLPEALRIWRALIEALAKAHELGIVHRDLKPENVMLAPEGVVKILDFGLAKVREAEDSDGPKEAQQYTTLEGSVLGTPGYMSPEQAAGRPTDARSDVFSLGVLFYELATGTRPFESASSGEMIAALLRDAHAPLRKRNREVPVALAAVVERCLSKAPERRYASAREVLEAIERARGGVGSPFFRWRAPALAAGAAILMVGVGAIAVRGSRFSARGSSMASSPSPSSTAPAVAITELPAPKTFSPEAAAEYASAMQAFRDASLKLGWKHLERSVELDPGFPAAHLWLATLQPIFGGTPLIVRRRHVFAARERRSELDEREGAMLEVVEADVQDPDYEATARRWRALSDRFPGDAAIASIAGRFNLDTDPTDDGLRLLERATLLDPKFAMPHFFRSWFFIQKNGDAEASANAASQCLSVSPQAASCLRRRALAEAIMGKCEDLARDARQAVEIEPDGPGGYDFLTTALVSRGAPVEAVLQASSKARELTFEPSIAKTRKLWAPIEGAWLTGDLATVVAHFPDWDEERRTTTSEDVAQTITGWETSTLTEAGQHERVRAILDDYRRRREALTQDSLIDARLYAFLHERRAGRVSARELKDRQEELARDAKSKLPPNEANAAWLHFYADVAETEDEAREALAALPAYSPLPPEPGDVDNGSGTCFNRELILGRTLRLAGRVEEAIPHLRSAARSCPSLLGILVHISASEELGEGLEATGDKAGACAAYGEVVSRWPNPKPRSITVDAARGHMRKLGCAK